MRKERVLIVDDEKLIRLSLKEALKGERRLIEEVEKGKEALKRIEESSFDLIILDMKLPDIDGLEVLEQIQSRDKSIPIIMITAYGDIKTAVRAIKLGAYDYISKPFDLEEVLFNVKKALETSCLRREVNELRSRYSSSFQDYNFIAESEVMLNILSLAVEISQHDVSPVLIQGESGTGKDMLARFIHSQSSRNQFPFMEISCVSFPETLIESELFGHEKGAFTDAREKREGLFEKAEGGTIYLDEIGDIPLQIQAKLLRVIESRTFKRLGGREDIKVDVSIIAATNKDLEKGISSGKFREDLYYRLKVIPIYLPPLRERKDDIIALAKFFTQKLSHDFKKEIKGLTKEAQETLLQYSWPGNVRELRNVIERAIILEKGEYLSSLHFPAEIKVKEIENKRTKAGESNIFPDYSLPLEELEKKLIKEALEKFGGNQSKASHLLGISRYTLRYRMKKFSLKFKVGIFVATYIQQYIS